MNDIRKKIQKKILLLSKDIIEKNISDFHNEELEEHFCIKNNFLDFDFSKQKINKESFDYLLQIPEFINLKQILDSLFAGEFENTSENTKVTHTIYRSDFNKKFPEIFSQRKQFKKFLESVKGKSTIRNLICIGIGGSRLGPEFLYEFQGKDEPFKVYFCSSIDLLELKDALRKCEQSQTLILTSSKSFQTTEIIKNLNLAKEWFNERPDIDFKNHLYAVSSNTQAMSNLGIKQDNQLHILNSLSGRFSLWSSISSPAFVNSGFSSYSELLEGAHMADDHTQNTPWESNIPVLMALLSVWNTNALSINNHAVFTYNYRLRSLTRYITQLSMESNGKSVNFKSEESPFLTSPLVWGGYGVENQHSTFQWLLQGKTPSSCDFIGLDASVDECSDSENMLLSQVIALTFGRGNVDEPFKAIEGNNPCSVFRLKKADLKSLGYLLALYEHKIFIEAYILGLDPFDQWGVQLGKNLLYELKKNKTALSKYFSSKFLAKP